jgi:hypothetical protein
VKFSIYDNIKNFSTKIVINNFFQKNFKNKTKLFFIRKQKVFNKGRYSRNRQNYRTGVYWCIYVNLAAVLGLNYLFYKFVPVYTYYW